MGDRPKKTWKEIDAMRDKARQSRDRDDRPRPSSPAALAAARSYRAALERAFEAGTLAELARTLSRSADIELPAAKPEAPAEPPAAPPPPPPADGAGTAAAAPAARASAAPPPAPTAAPRDPERENRMKLLARIQSAEGRDPITRAIDAFLARYPKLPADFEILTKALSHKQDDRVREALAQLADLLAREKPRRGRALAAQLRFLEETHAEPDIRKMAAELGRKL